MLVICAVKFVSHRWDCFLVKRLIEGNDACVFFGLLCFILQVNINFVLVLVPGIEHRSVHFRFGLDRAPRTKRSFLYLAQGLLLLFMLFQLLLMELRYRQIMFAEWLQRLLFGLQHTHLFLGLWRSRQVQRRNRFELSLLVLLF